VSCHTPLPAAPGHLETFTQGSVTARGVWRGPPVPLSHGRRPGGGARALRDRRRRGVRAPRQGPARPHRVRGHLALHRRGRPAGGARARRQARAHDGGHAGDSPRCAPPSPRAGRILPDGGLPADRRSRGSRGRMGYRDPRTARCVLRSRRPPPARCSVQGPDHGAGKTRRVPYGLLTVPSVFGGAATEDLRPPLSGTAMGLGRCPTAGVPRLHRSGEGTSGAVPLSLVSGPLPIWRAGRVGAILPEAEGGRADGSMGGERWTWAWAARWR
jgi:hypothetical protein